MAKKVRNLKFIGTFEEIQDVVKRTGILGKWVPNRKAKQTYLPVMGGEIDWSTSSGKIKFTGPPVQKATLEVSFRLMRFVGKERSMCCRNNLNYCNQLNTAELDGCSCEACFLLPQLIMALSNSGQYPVLLNDELRVLDKSERDDYRKSVAKGRAIHYREL